MKRQYKIITFLLIIFISLSYINVFKVKGEEYKSKYDPRELGLMTSVKDQGNLNVCWCFAGMAAVESYLKLKGYGEYDFSEEHVRWWGTLRDGYGFKRESYDPASFSVVKNYLTSAGGVRLEEDIPYNPSENATIPENMDTASPKFYVTDIVEIPNDMNKVKKGILESGGVVSSYRSNNIFSGKTMNEYYCNDETFVKDEQHAILIVGWDDNYSKDNFKDNNKPKNNGAWLIKNSWGNYNDEGGYFWISYEDKTLLQAEDNFYISGVCDINDGKRIYQHDEFGPTAYIYSIDNETKEEKQIIECANVYDFEDGYDVLEGITFMTSSIGAKYKISYAQVEDTNIIDENKTIVLAEGTVPHAGFITASVDGVKVPEGKGYIIVSIDNSGNNKEALIGAETLSDNCVRKINKGESYMIVQNYAIDSFEYSDEENAENYTIKVIARNTEGKIVAQDIIDKQKEALNESETNNNSSANRSSEAISEKGDFILIIELVSILLVIIFFINKSRRK